MKLAFQESFTNENLELCVSLNSIKKIIFEKGSFKGREVNKNNIIEEYSPDKISNVFLLKDDIQLLSRIDKDFSNQVLQDNIEEDKQNNIYSQEAYEYVPYNFNDNIEDNLEPDNPNDMSFHSIVISDSDNIENDINSEGSKESKGTFNRFIESSQKQIQVNPLIQFETVEGNKENNIHGLSYRKSILNNKLDFTSHLQQIGRGGDFFDKLKPKGIQQRLNWENVLESGMKQKEMIEKKKEESDRRAKVLFDFREENIKEIVYRKEGKKMNKKRNNEDEMRKNRVMIGYRTNLCMSLFSNVNMRISEMEGEERLLNRLEDEINENELEEVKKSNEKENENEKDNYDIGNIYVDDDNEFNDNNTEVKIDPFYSNSTHKINIYSNYRNNLDEEKRRLENLYKVINVRKIKKQIFDKIEEFQLKENKKKKENGKELDFISLVNGVNDVNKDNNNRNGFVNPATCFVSLLHLCNEKSKYISIYIYIYYILIYYIL
jgi:hypothetical protein